MKRLRRTIFNTLTVLSLLLIPATVGLWVRSYFCEDLVAIRSTYYVIALESRENVTLLLDNSNSGANIPTNIESNLCESVGAYPEYTNPNINVLGIISFWRVSNPPSVLGIYQYFYAIRSPHWFFALIFAILPTIWLFKWNERRKLGPNACPSCAYDLTGNTTGHCPECGAQLTNDSITESQI